MLVVAKEPERCKCDEQKCDTNNVGAGKMMPSSDQVAAWISSIDEQDSFEPF